MNLFASSICHLTLQQVWLRLIQSAIHCVYSRIMVDPNLNIFVHYLKGSGLGILVIKLKFHE